MFRSTLCYLLLALLCISFAAADDNDVQVMRNGNMHQLRVRGELVHSSTTAITQSKVVSVDRATEVATWVEEGTPFFSIRNNGQWISAKSSSHQLMLRHGAFDPTKSTQRVKASLRSREDSRLFIVQFATQGLEVYRQALRAMGVEVHKYLPHHSHIVRMDATKVEEVKNLSFVRWVGPMHPAYKLEANMLAKTRSSALYNVVAIAKNDKKELISQIARIGGKVVNPTTGSLLIVAQLTPQQVTEVSHLDTVLWIDEDTPIEEDMDKARIQGGADHIETKMGGFTGKGINGHVLEGIYRNHPDFSPTENKDWPVVIDDGNPSSHGQNTYGQIFGSGKGNSKARGLVPEAQGFYTNYNAVYSAPAGSKSPGSRYELVERLMRDHKVMFQTASWGYSRTREYTSRSAEMDDLIFDLDMPITQSQSNAGNPDSRPQAWAKNVISVGALRHFNTVDTSDDRWSRGGSTGPASDGRIKPDLCAYYDQIDTTAGASGYTSSFGGTSGATPIVAGHVALTIQLWTEGVFGNTLKAPKADRFANIAHFTTTKALLIASARQYNFSGTSHDATRVHQGWGFPDVKHMFDQRAKVLIVDESDVIKNLESKVYSVNVGVGEPELKVSMTYADPAANVGASIHRINNLDLKVTAPDGTVYFGNNGLKANMYSTSGGTANDLDTVENVFVKNPTAGTWKVEVIASELNTDGHVETSEIDADFALVVFGITK